MSVMGPTKAAAAAAAAAALLILAAGASAAPGALQAVYVAQGVATQPDAPAWKEAPPAVFTLTPQIIIPPNGGGSVSQVGARAMHDGEWLAVRLEWADATPDRAVGVDTFRDAVAVGFPTGESEPPPSPFMGDADHPVTIWQWTADFDADARGQGGFADRYPHTEGVWYFPQDAAVERDKRAWRGADPVVEFVATGWGTLTRTSSREVRAASRHAEGKWQVVLRRRLSTGNVGDAAFKPGETTRLILAVWDGAHAEVNGRKSVTLAWAPFELAPTLPASAARR